MIDIFSDMSYLNAALLARLTAATWKDHAAVFRLREFED